MKGPAATPQALSQHQPDMTTGHRQHTQSQPVLCSAISGREVKVASKDNPKGRNPELGKTSYLTPKQDARLVKMIGRRCLVHCTLDKVPTLALWDTGAQASIISEEWRSQHLPQTAVRPVEELLGPGTLIGVAANQTEIPFVGWVEVEFQLNGKLNQSQRLHIPVLVSSDPNVAEEPIIGFNVIEEIVKGPRTLEGETPIDGTVNMVRDAFSVSVKAAKELVQIMQVCRTNDSSCVVRTGKGKVRLPPGQATTIQGRAHMGTLEEDQVMLFVPTEELNWPEGVEVMEGLVTVSKRNPTAITISVVNTSKHNITLGQHATLGHMQPVKAAYPAAVRSLEHQNDHMDSAESPRQMCKDKRSQVEPQGHAWDPPVDLHHLSTAQQAVAKKMLREECNAFSQDDYDVGHIPSLRMHITLHDKTPVQKTYTSVPKPLHHEVKEYLQDLLNRGWITKSRSHYSSPIVCV